VYPESRLGDAIDRLMTRRSVKAMDIIAPGPTAEELTQILQTAIRVPDHGKLGPWRFIRFAGDARAKFGDVLAARYAEQNVDARTQNIEAERGRFVRAPVVIAVVARITADIKIPEWEQQLSVGAVCQNMLVASSLMGFAAQWLTEWYAFDPSISDTLGLTDNERVAGFVYIGSAKEKPPERVRPNLEQVLSDWQTD
jgi:nitroreductase